MFLTQHCKKIVMNRSSRRFRMRLHFWQVLIISFPELALPLSSGTGNDEELGTSSMGEGQHQFRAKIGRGDADAQARDSYSLHSFGTRCRKQLREKQS